MTDEEFERERRRQARFEKLRTDTPRCGVCGEGDDRCLELHHLAGRKFEDFLVINCRNCHRKVSDDQKDHPAFDPGADKLLDAIGHFLLGLADMLKLIIEKLYEFGQALIERAKPVAGREL